jgi:hypothetical protein
VVQYIVRILLEHVRRAASGAPGEARTLSELLALAVKNGETPDLADKLKHEATRMLTLATNLVNAIAEGQLELHYQPIVSLKNRSLAGFEALIRWRHPTLGMVRPDEFIPLAEKTDLIHRIGEFVVQQALTDWPMLKPLCDGAVEGVGRWRLARAVLLRPGRPIWLRGSRRALLAARGAPLVATAAHHRLGKAFKGSFRGEPHLG